MNEIIELPDVSIKVEGSIALYFKATPEEVKGWIVFVGGTTL
jgi:hypothetical protein